MLAYSTGICTWQVETARKPVFNQNSYLVLKPSQFAFDTICFQPVQKWAQLDKQNVKWKLVVHVVITNPCRKSPTLIWSKGLLGSLKSQQDDTCLMNHRTCFQKQADFSMEIPVY